MVRAAEHARKETKFAQGGFEFVSLAGHILESSCKHLAGVEDATCLVSLLESERFYYIFASRSANTTVN